MSSAAARRRYAQDGTGVVSNARLLILLFERLDRDLAEAAAHSALGDRGHAHEAIVHAQEILYELIGALDTEAWEGADALQKIYVYCLNETIEGNIAQDAARIEKCRDLLRPIGTAWHDATRETPAAVGDV